MEEDDFVPRFAFRNIIDAIVVYRALLCYRKTLIDLGFTGSAVETLDSILLDWQSSMNDPHGVQRAIRRQIEMGKLPSEADISQALETQD